MLNRSCQPYPRTHEFLERILHPLTAVTTPGQGDVLLSKKLVALEQDWARGTEDKDNDPGCLFFDLLQQNHQLRGLNVN